MSKVLLDNWELSTCAGALLEGSDRRRRSQYGYYGNYRTNESIESCWQNLLTCIVLWDDIYLNDDELSSSLDEMYVRELCSFITSHSDDPSFLHHIDRGAIPEWRPEYEVLRGLYERIRQNDKVSKEEIILLLRGYTYITDSSWLGCNYLPHPRRATLLKDSKLFQKILDRRLYLDIVDEDIKEFLDCISELSNYQLEVVHFPVLYKFIHDNAKTPEEQLLMALSLREDRDAKKFRESLDTIENELEKGNRVGYYASIARAKEICDEITSQIYKRPISIEVSLGLSPAINFGWEPKRRAKSKLHTTFLRKLANYSLTGEYVY